MRLAAGERGGAALPDGVELHRLAGAGDLAGVFLAPLVEPALMRVAAVLHQLLDADAFGQHRPLWQEGQLARQRLERIVRQWLAVDFHRAALQR
ncbi:hypothetical protein D3C77_746060 [compost metagenome]